MMYERILVFMVCLALIGIILGMFVVGVIIENAYRSKR